MFIEGYNRDDWFKNEESTDKTRSYKDKSDMPPLEGDEQEVKEGQELKILTLNELLTGLPIIIAQLKARNNLYKLKNKIRKMLYLLYQHYKITKNVYNNLIKSL